MKNNSTLSVFLIVGLLVIFIGVTAIFLLVNRAKEKENIILSNEKIGYTSSTEEWSIDYPANWYIKEDQASDRLVLSDHEITDLEEQAIYIQRIEKEKIQKFIALSADTYDIIEEKDLSVDGIDGYLFTGTVKENVPSMFPAGHKSAHAFFQLNKDVISLYVDVDKLFPVYYQIVDSIRFDLESKSEDISTIENKEANIVVTKPQTGDTMTSPYVIEGMARVFENTVSYELVDGNNEILAEGFTTALAPDIGQFGDFSQPITFSSPTTKNGTLRVFSLSAKDGSRQDVVEVNVTFNK